MEPMLKVVEVAELMGCSSQYIRRMAKDGKIQGQKQDNGGNTLEWVFPVSALAEPYQQRYFDQQKQPSAVALAQKLSGDGTPPKKPLDYYTAEEREAIAFWMRLVSDWLDYRKKPGANKAKVDEQFVLLCKLEHPELQISIDTLYRRWKAIKEKDYDGLIDKRGKWKKGKSTIDETLWQAFLSFYLDESQHPIKRCYEYTKIWAQSDFPDQVPDIPSYSSFYRSVQSDIT